MSLDKAIEHGKEHRKQFGDTRNTRYKSIDCQCRNHGSCDWCLNNRIYKNKKRELSCNQQMEEFKEDV